MIAGILVAGYWADHSSPRRVIMVGCALTVVVGFLMAPMMERGSLFLVLAFLCLALFCMGLVYGPAGTLLSELFPARVRYTGSSIGYNVGGIIGGGFTPVIAQTLADRGGLTYVGIYLSGAALISLAALLAIPRQTVQPSLA